MKFLKRFKYLFTHKEIVKICDKYNINKYHINDDGTVDVDGNVLIVFKNLTKLPLKFGKVTGDFSIEGNRLTSLEGCPYYVGKSFMCRYNRLTSLEHGPEFVGGNYYCRNNNLTSLRGIPEDIKFLNIDDNPISKYWEQVLNDRLPGSPYYEFLECLEIFLYMDIDTEDGDEICQEKVDYILNNKE